MILEAKERVIKNLTSISYLIKNSRQHTHNNYLSAIIVPSMTECGFIHAQKMAVYSCDTEWEGLIYEKMSNNDRAKFLCYPVNKVNNIQYKIISIMPNDFTNHLDHAKNNGQNIMHQLNQIVI